MIRFFNSDETGIEGVQGAVANAAKKVVKSANDQADVTTQDFVNQLYGVPSESQDENADPGTEQFGQMQKKATAAQKGQANVRNPAAQQAAQRRAQMMKKGYKPEEIDKIEKLRKLLHDQQVRDLFEPKKKQQEEEPVAEKLEREEQEKKQKEQQKQQEEVKKKEDLSVVQKRTAAERRPGAG